MLVVSLLVCSILVVLEGNGLNLAFDYVVIVYVLVTIIALVFSLVQAGNKSTIEERLDIDNRRFVFTKRPKVSTKDWKQMFEGSFDMYERRNFVPYLAFNGVSSFLARIANGNAFTQIIEFKDSGEYINVRSTGTPPFKGCWMKITSSEETAPFTDVDDNGKLLKFKAWWDEENKQLRLKFLQHNPNGTIWISDQWRKLTDENNMHKTMIMYHEDGSSATFEEFLRRKP